MMETNSFSFLSYKELRNISKTKSSFLLKAEIAYKQERYSRSIHSLKKLRDQNPVLIDQYIFFRSLGEIEIDEILNFNSSDELIYFCQDYLRFYLGKPTKEEIVEKNFYLYLLLYYFPNNSTIDLAYGYPKDKYGEALYVFSLYKKVFLIKDLRKYSKEIEKGHRGVRDILNLYERETLDYISRNDMLDLNSFLLNEIKGYKYSELNSLRKDARAEVIQSLKEKDCINIENEHIELLPGGFFLLSCY